MPRNRNNPSRLGRHLKNRKVKNPSQLDRPQKPAKQEKAKKDELIEIFDKISNGMKAANESCEETEIRLAITRDYRLAGRTPQELAARLAEQIMEYEKEELPPGQPLQPFQEDESHLKMWPDETPQQWARRLAQPVQVHWKGRPPKARSTASRDRSRRRRAEETPEEHARRLLLTRQNSRVRRNNETAEERRDRLAAGRDRARLKRSTLETAEERERRLAAVRERHRLKRSTLETVEERERRLAAGRDRARLKRSTLETAEERERRLAAARERARLRRSTLETAEERERRLAAARERARLRRSTLETAEERECRLAAGRERNRRINDSPGEEKSLRLKKRAAYIRARRATLAPEVIQAANIRRSEREKERRARMMKTSSAEELAGNRMKIRERKQEIKEMETEELRVIHALEGAENVDAILEEDVNQKVIEWWYHFRSNQVQEHVREWRADTYSMIKERDPNQSGEERKTQLAKNFEKMKEYYRGKAEKIRNYHQRNKEELNAYSRMYWRKKKEGMTPEEITALKERQKQRDLDTKAGIPQKLGRKRIQPGAVGKSRQKTSVPFLALAPPPTRRRRSAKPANLTGPSSSSTVILDIGASAFPLLTSTLSPHHSHENPSPTHSFSNNGHDVDEGMENNQWLSLAPSFHSATTNLQPPQFGNHTIGINDGFVDYIHNQLPFDPPHDPSGDNYISNSFHPSSQTSSLMPYKNQNHTWNCNMMDMELPLNYSLNLLPNPQPLLPHPNVQPSSSWNTISTFQAAFVPSHVEDEEGRNCPPQSNSYPLLPKKNNRKITKRVRKRLSPKKQTEPIVEEFKSVIVARSKSSNPGPVNPEPMEMEQFRKRLRPKCPHCSVVFKSQWAFQRHLKTHESKANYSCKVCTAGFMTQRELKHHIWFGHYDSKRTYECPMCPSKFRWRQHLQAHITKSHPSQAKSSFILGVSFKKAVKEIENFHCSLCPAVFKGFLELDEHFTCSHKPQLMHFCKYCGIMLRMQDHLTEHLLRFHSQVEEEQVEMERDLVPDEQKLPQCSVCESRFLKEQFLAKHSLSAHTRNSIKINGSFYCSGCQRRFRSKNGRNKHFLRNCLGKNLSCYWCEEDFMTEQDLQIHMKNEHTQEKSIPSRIAAIAGGYHYLYKCELCPRSFNTIAVLRTHFSYEHEEVDANEDSAVGEGSKSCTDNGTNDPSTILNTAQVVSSAASEDPTLVPTVPSSIIDLIPEKSINPCEQTPLTLHQCETCLSNFSTAQFLDIHTEREHADPKKRRRHLCELCNRTFTTNHTLVRHTKQFHNPDRKLYQCPHCPMQFGRAEHVRGHVKRVHDNPEGPQKSKRRTTGQLEKPFKCEICSKSFAKEPKLNIHVTNIHFPQHFSTFCEYCGKQIRPEYMLGHIRKVHPQHAPVQVKSKPTFKKLPLPQILSLLSEIEGPEKQIPISKSGRRGKGVGQGSTRKKNPSAARGKGKKMESSSEDSELSSSTSQDEDDEYFSYESSNSSIVLNKPTTLRLRKTRTEPSTFPTATKANHPSGSTSKGISSCEGAKWPMLVLRRCDQSVPGLISREGKRKRRLNSNPPPVSLSSDVVMRRVEDKSPPHSKQRAKRRAKRVQYAYESESEEDFAIPSTIRAKKIPRFLNSTLSTSSTNNEIRIKDVQIMKSLKERIGKLDQETDLPSQTPTESGISNELRLEEGGDESFNIHPTWVEIPEIITKVEVKEEQFQFEEDEAFPISLSPLTPFGNESETEFIINPSEPF